jgi:hypothetical protein
MTEAEWQTTIHPTLMLDLLRETGSDRKLRLFACACVRAGWHLLQDDRSREAVEIAERHADGLADGDELSRGCDAAHLAIIALEKSNVASGQPEHERKVEEATCAAHWCAVEDAWESAGELLAWHFVDDEGPLQATFLRDIFSNPFRPVAVDPAWLTSTVVALARSIYDERAFDRLPILADALEDAGCDSADVLDHCRGDGPHVRGCWVVDLLLGKA